ncbi:hypothetical protein H5P33_06880 [Mycolicibacterium arabiense]|uniref:hypothetical protein n=1 Tax=Mycolicibacterium arabiense TaxID=1286181 RepID=UPI0021F26A8B|nr:hypothetical protein [Mycolicibacterium arabiense]MCV7372434.1 hypothetical protein [Mycolicibacterium arabiense]
MSTGSNTTAAPPAVYNFTADVATTDGTFVDIGSATTVTPITPGRLSTPSAVTTTDTDLNPANAVAVEANVTERNAA